MVSNGMSNRRMVLKRPIVCKSLDQGLCGDCKLTVQAVPNPCDNNEHVSLEFQLDCKTLPVDPNYDIFLITEFAPDDPPADIVAGGSSSWGISTTTIPGDYLIQAAAVNSQKCTVTAEVTLTVLPH